MVKIANYKKIFHGKIVISSIDIDNISKELRAF